MENDQLRPVATNPDQPRLTYTLTLDDVAPRFEAAGFPRDRRSLQRYCATGRLDAIKADTPTGEQYLVNEESVERAIKQMQQAYALSDKARQAAADPDLSRKVAPESSTPTQDDEPRPVATGRGTAESKVPVVPSETNPDEPRHVATDRDDRLIGLLEENVTFLKEQLKIKDRQIEVLATANEAILTRLGETNVLIKNDQSLFEKVQTALLGLLPGRTGGEPRVAGEATQDTHTAQH